ncbi:MAG TPA: TonB-dependent receptor, partial [Bacillota bacterium]|nr:TonB-dependent receptor [Bacillota bacterium]
GTPWQVYLKANNLTDRLAYAHTSFIKTAAPLMGRNITLGVKVAF